MSRGCCLSEKEVGDGVGGGKMINQMLSHLLDADEDDELENSEDVRLGHFLQREERSRLQGLAGIGGCGNGPAMNLGSGRVMGGYGPDRANFSHFASFHQGIPGNMSGSMGQGQGQGYVYVNQNPNYAQSQQFLPSQQFYQNQNQVYQNQANQFQQINHGRFCQCNICSQSDMTQFQSCQASQRSRINSNSVHSTQPFYPTHQTQSNPRAHPNPQPRRPSYPHSKPSALCNNPPHSLNSDNSASNIQSSNIHQSNPYPKNPNFLSETAASQNLEDQNLSEVSNNCASTLSQKNADLNFTSNKIQPNAYSPFNKSPFMQHTKMPTVSNNVGLLFNCLKCAEVKEEISEDEDIIESDYLIKEFTKIELGKHSQECKAIVGGLAVFLGH